MVKKGKVKALETRRVTLVRIPSDIYTKLLRFAGNLQVSSGRPVSVNSIIVESIEAFLQCKSLSPTR